MERTILVVDDDEEIRELLRLYLEKEGYRVIQAENGIEALEVLTISQIDLLVIDIMMPELDGYQLIETLRCHSNVPIIIISAKTENFEKIFGLDLGADDYVTKPFDPMEVSARVRAQLRRCMGSNTMYFDDVISVGSLNLDTSSCILEHNGESIHLTATEFNILKLFMVNPGKVFTKQQIYEVAWQSDIVVDDNTVMVAISKLRGKLPTEKVPYIRTIRGLGYRLEVPK